MNVLFVAGTYFPNANANTICMEKLVNALKTEGHNVSVIVPRKNIKENEHDLIHENNVYRVCSDVDKFYWAQDECKKFDLPLKMNLIHRISYALFRGCNKVYCAIKRVDFVDVNQKEQIRCMAEAIIDICENENIDLIISVSVPFITHLSVAKAYNELEKKPKWITYLLDPYGGSKWVTDIYGKEKLQNEEKEVFSKCDLILMLNVLKEEYMNEYYSEYHYKMRTLKPTLFDLELPQDITNIGIDSIPDSISLLYAGTLYDMCREYGSLLSLIDKLIELENVKVHIMGKAQPKSAEKIEQLRKKYPNNFFSYGRMPYEFAKGSINRADILINIGNDYTDIIPSKIFEYMAARKPILNFYRIDKDTTLPYLKKYPLCLNIDERDSIDHNIKKIQAFMQQVRNKVSISKEEMQDIFYDDLTEQVQKKFLSFVNECIDL